MQHVLEHVIDDENTLNTLRKMLRPQGRLIVAVPNFGCLSLKLLKNHWGWLQVPVHIRHYTFSSLNRLLDRCGFEVENHSTRGADTLMWVLTALSIFGISPFQKSKTSTAVSTKIVSMVSAIFKYFFMMGSEELVIFSRPRP
jgi:hypothetical protein